MKKQILRTIKSKPLKRTLELNRSKVDEETRTVPVAFSSEEPVSRWFGNEILDHSRGAVRLERLNKAGAVLWNHNPDDLIGVPEDIQIGTDKVGRASIRFGKSAKAEEIYQGVLDGTIRNISVGYMIHKMQLEEPSKSTEETYRAIDWEPYEISLVSIPADMTVGVGRANEETETEIQIIGEEKRTMKKCQHCGVDLADGAECQCAGARAAKGGQQVDVKGIERNAEERGMKRAADMMSLGEKFGKVELARKFMQEGKSVEDLRCAILESMGARQVDPAETPEIGMSQKEIRQYSIVKAIRQLANNETLDGLEKEASDETAKRSKREAKGFFIPQDVMGGKRALSAGSLSGGGALVSDNLMPDMIELLRNKTLVARLGARTLSGLVGNVLIPKVTGGATAYWLPENGEVTPSDQAFGQLGLTPRRLVGDTAFSKELLIQSSPDVEALVREDLMRVIAIAKDLAAINGSGDSGQPRGILNTTGIGSVTFGAAATWAKVIDFETQVADANADLGSMAYLTTPSVRGKWKAASKVANTAVFLWEGGSNGSGLVNGYRAEATKQVPTNKVIFGNWNDLVLADWAGIDVVVDPYSLKKTGQIEVTVTIWTDCGIRHAGSFCVSTDSGAQ